MQIEPTTSLSPPLAVSSWNLQSLLSACVVVVMLLCLPLAAWLDIQTLTAHSAVQQTSNVKSMITEIRGYYAKEVVARVTPFDGKSEIIHNFREVPGAIPNPATMAIELGNLFKNTQTNVEYRFISDFPFQGRTPHTFDEWETEALQALRKNPKQEISSLQITKGNVVHRVATPIVMDAVCIGCHASHPLSPKRDWQMGDVRGIQEFTVTLPIADNIFAFKYLFSYMVVAAILSLWFLIHFRSQLQLQAQSNQAQKESNAQLLIAMQRQEQHHWIKNCESQVITAMRGHQTVNDFAQKVLSAMVPQLGGKVAAFYYLNATSNQFEMVGSYCYPQLPQSSISFAPGEGLVGQCALNRAPIVLTHLPPDYLQVVAGTMDICAGHLYMVPIIPNGHRVIAVIEIATLSLLNENQQLLLNELSALIAHHIPNHSANFFD